MELLNILNSPNYKRKERRCYTSKLQYNLLRNSLVQPAAEQNLPYLEDISISMQYNKVKSGFRVRVRATRQKPGRTYDGKIAKYDYFYAKTHSEAHIMADKLKSDYRWYDISITEIDQPEYEAFLGIAMQYIKEHYWCGRSCSAFDSHAYHQERTREGMLAKNMWKKDNPKAVAAQKLTAVNTTLLTKEQQLKKLQDEVDALKTERAKYQAIIDQ